jgi:hypothetical protein
MLPASALNSMNMMFATPLLTRELARRVSEAAKGRRARTRKRA